MSPLEIFGVLTGAICVLLAAKENILNWPIGIVNNVLFFVMFWRNKLYADATLQIFYIAIAIYGWWRWSHAEGGGVLKVRSTSKLAAGVLLLISTLGWALAFRSIIGVLLTALLVVPLVARMQAEETLLGERFGEAYAAYRARSWRLVPWIY